MPLPPINQLFAQDISRRIEEVIKVDQVDAQILTDEIAEYVFTRAIRDHYHAFLERYRETPNKPHEGIAVWVSGFFGSGKSSFAKNLGIAVANRNLLGQDAARLFGVRSGDPRVQVLLQTIVEQIPTHAVIFDISTDRGIRTGSQSVTEIMYRLFLDSLGYAKDLDLAELEVTLEGEGSDRLRQFEETFARIYGKPWSQQKGLVSIALSGASRVMHELDPATYPTPDSWVQAARQRADITPGLLADRCKELMRRRRPGQTLLFVIDEVGQFVARDVQKMLDLQAVVQSLGRVGRGTMWVVVTSQEKLNELVGGLDDRRVELARLMDRFPQELQVHLEPADISEVTGKRVLSKNAMAQALLRPIFEANRGALEAHTRLTADIKLPELSADRFIDLYPLLPYQVDLIIQVVSGLRTRGGTSKHVGGANRTIIKLAQQLLINPAVDLASQPVGALVRLDQIYDLVEGNIDSDIRGKIAALPGQVDHPLAQPVAKTICLLQYVQSVHRTPENIAAALYPAVGADSQLVEVRAALAELVQRHLVREGDDGYRIPTPTEDDWERQRAGLVPSGSDTRAIYDDLFTRLWSPQPAVNFLQTKQFRAGLLTEGRSRIEGDISVSVYLAQPGELAPLADELRRRSQGERTTIFWAVPLDHAIDREQQELYRSREILSRKDRSAQTREETRLVTEEGRRRARHEDELRRLLRQAFLRGTVFFRGNDRSPDERASDMERTVAGLLATVLPEVFDRFEDAAARVQSRDLDVLLGSENLLGLTPVFARLNLIREQGGKPTFTTDHGPLAEVYGRIANRASQQESANGRYLTDEFGKVPFGWEFDTVRLLTAALLRAGKIEMTSRGQVIESATTLEARSTFGNNNLFRQASFRPRSSTLTFQDLIQAAQAFQTTFGREIAELEQSVIAEAIRAELSHCEPNLQEAHTTLLTHQLPGAHVLADALNQTRAIRGARQETAIQTFTGSAHQIQEAVRRAAELGDALNDPSLEALRAARVTLHRAWPFLRDEPDRDPTVTTAAEQLDDILRRETFYRELPAITQHAEQLRSAYGRHEYDAVQARATAYRQALEQLAAIPGWDKLDADQQARVAQPLRRLATADTGIGTPIPQIRADTDACPARLGAAVEQMLRLLDDVRLVRVSAARFFQGGIETEEELAAALDGLRAEVERLIGEGKKVLIQ
ncbi:MAG: BREX system P-loop protein BrxC [Chloroflexales bacterium]